MIAVFCFLQPIYNSLHSILGDCDWFLNLYQFSPKGKYLSLDMIIWTWVEMVTDDEKGIEFLSEMRKEISINRAHLAFVNVILGLTFIWLYKKK